jgi:uncharacterized Zn finger protein
MINKKLLREMASEPSFSRGVQYFEEQRVSNLHIQNGRITATVSGSQPYHVELRDEDGDLQYSCTCPFYDTDLAFCKHCVAVGLAFLHNGNTSDKERGRSGTPARNELQMKDVRKYLEAQDKTVLVEFLLDQAKDDERLKFRLQRKAGMTQKTIHLPTFRKAIDRAVDWGDFVDYKSMHEYSKGLEDVISSLRELLHEGHAAEAIELSEYFLRGLEEQMNMMDDSDGYMTDILFEMQELHHEACLTARPDAEKLARKLFEWETKSNWDVFYGAVERYADVLGDRGVSVYRELTEKQWKDLPSIGPDDHDERHSMNRFRITSIMERLASQSGNLEKLVEVKAKDLSSAFSYLEIAELYQEAKEADRALEWAEKGVQAFSEHTDARLREFLATEYHRRGRHEEAMQLIWQELTESPHLQQYKLLKAHAQIMGGVKAWKLWREKALSFMKEGIASAKSRAKKNRSLDSNSDRSELVQIFLWEKNVDAAWGEAQEGGCREDLWLDLALKREADYPEDALAVYQTLVEPAIDRKNNESYRRAVSLVLRIRTLLARLNRREEWVRYVESLRATHRRKRNFIEMLEQGLTTVPSRHSVFP